MNKFSSNMKASDINKFKFHRARTCCDEQLGLYKSLGYNHSFYTEIQK